VGLAIAKGVFRRTRGDNQDDIQRWWDGDILEERASK